MIEITKIFARQSLAATAAILKTPTQDCSARFSPLPSASLQESAEYATLSFNLAYYWKVSGCIFTLSQSAGQPTEIIMSVTGQQLQQQHNNVLDPKEENSVLYWTGSSFRCRQDLTFVFSSPLRLSTFFEVSVAAPMIKEAVGELRTVPASTLRRVKWETQLQKALWAVVSQPPPVELPNPDELEPYQGALKRQTAHN